MKNRLSASIVAVVLLGGLCCGGWQYYRRACLGLVDPIRVPAKSLAGVTIRISDTDRTVKEFHSSDARLGAALVEVVNTSIPTIYCPVGNIGTITFSYADGSTNRIGFVPGQGTNSYRLVKLAPPDSGRDILSYSTVDKQRFVSIMTQYGLDASWLEWPHERKTKVEEDKPKMDNSVGRSSGSSPATTSTR